MLDDLKVTLDVGSMFQFYKYNCLFILAIYYGMG